ncbi:MAG: virulence protein SciE type [Gammaproteobacteria bacterium]|nr:virulence protein SciE type [Gammaproteobacteria bacterium]
MEALESLSEGKLEETLGQLQASVRSDPSNVKYRVFLFQLLAVMGQWDRALTQLNVAGELDVSTLAMVQTYREALLCEGLRAEVFAGKRSPIVFGKPEQWIALVFEALRLTADGQYAQSQDIREQAFEQAPVTSGTIGDPDGQVFNWIADADSRIGPMLEAIINGRYYWVPFHRIRTINIVAPEDMRDMVWTPVYFTWANGGETVGLIPTRYPDSEDSDDNQIRTAHKTIWQEHEADVYLGLGQRMFATDEGEFSLMDLRLISLDTQDEEETQVPQTSEINSMEGLDTDG